MTKTNKDTGPAYVALAYYRQGGMSWGCGDTREDALMRVKKAARRDFRFRGPLKAMLYETRGENLTWYQDGTVWTEDNRNVAAEGEFVEIAA